MAAFIELRTVGDGRAIIEAGSIAGIITAKGSRVDTVATHSKPMSIILRGGETLEIYGESPARLLVRAGMVKKEVREQGFDIKCDFLDAPQPDGTSDESGPVSGD